MHRIMVHDRQGAPWDLKGRWLGQPVFRLLGGPARDSVPAYASMPGFAALDMGRVRNPAVESQALGYRAQRWFFRHGPLSGAEGMRRNVELVCTLRETLGDDDDSILDCWQSFDPANAVHLTDRIAAGWRSAGCRPGRQLSAGGGAHGHTLSGAEYTRWGFRRFIDAKAPWIAIYASVHDLVVIQQGHSTPAGLHFSLAQSPMLTPMQEYLVKWNAINRDFLANPIIPVHGGLTPPKAPGLGMDLGPAKIRTQSELYTE